MSDVTAQQIVEAIRTMGVRAGDLLLAHSSFKSFGGVDGGPSTVAQSLVDVVSPGGTVFVPTFNYGKLAYDPRATSSLTGAITEAFRTLPAAKRSLQPTHSLCAIGPHADEFLADHEKTTPFGPGSPLWKLWEKNAWVLLIGCDHRSSSIIHVAEEIVAVPYLKRTRIARVFKDDREIELIVRRPGCSKGFHKIDAPLRAAGKIIDGRAGAARLFLMRARDVVGVAENMLRADPAALLCLNPGCEVCAGSREMICFSKKGN